MPGLGLILSARVLGEFGDDPTRFVIGRGQFDSGGLTGIAIRGNQTDQFFCFVAFLIGNFVLNDPDRYRRVLV
jgi:hypothetical protein